MFSVRSKDFSVCTTLADGDRLTHYAVHCAAEKHLVLVVHRHDDEELGSARSLVQNLSQGILLVQEVVGLAGVSVSPCRSLQISAHIARRSSVAHVSEFAIVFARAPLQ